MYRGNIDYIARSNSSLSFNKGDKFLEYKFGVNEKDGWIYVINEELEVGFIQQRFVTKIEVRNVK